MRTYTVGEPCDVCYTPTIQGKNGAYCWPCWKKWKNDKDMDKNATQATTSGNNDVIDKIREWSKTVEARLAKLEATVQTQEGLIRKFRTKEAIELHTSLEEVVIPEIKL